MKQVNSIEKEMNNHCKLLYRIFSVGKGNPKDKDRIDIASTSTNVLPPPLYGMRKDHKAIPPGKEQSGPPMRPVCAAKSAPNSRMSGILCRIINDVCDGVEKSSEVRSAEEMRAGLEKFN